MNGSNVELEVARALWRAAVQRRKVMLELLDADVVACHNAFKEVRGLNNGETIELETTNFAIEEPFVSSLTDEQVNVDESSCLKLSDGLHNPQTIVEDSDDFDLLDVAINQEPLNVFFK